MKRAFDPQPTVLEGTYARLEPLHTDHAEDLLRAGDEEAIWRFMPVPRQTRVEQTRDWIQAAVSNTPSTEVPFAIVSRRSGRAVGSTRFMDIQRENRNLEIGWTWLGKQAQRTAINTECKWLLLCHVFDDLGAVRVQLKTDGRNVRSQTAILRIGAKREGVLRKHRMTWAGDYRDTAYFSVLDDEWPDVKAGLALRLDASA